MVLFFMFYGIKSLTSSKKSARFLAFLQTLNSCKLAIYGFMNRFYRIAF